MRIARTWGVGDLTVKVSLRENGVVVRITVLLGGTGMAPFVSRNRWKKIC